MDNLPVPSKNVRFGIRGDGRMLYSLIDMIFTPAALTLLFISEDDMSRLKVTITFVLSEFGDIVIFLPNDSISSRFNSSRLSRYTRRMVL